jgi:membrane protein YdbS with pleckstrin-like domain
MHADKVNDRAKWVVQWIIMIVGLLFTLGAAIIMRPAGLVNFNVLITLIAVILVISVFGLLIYWIIEKLINLR